MAGVAIGQALQIILVLRLGLPEIAGGCHPGDHLAGPQTGRVDVGDGVFGDPPLLIGRGEDRRTVGGTEVIALTIDGGGVVDLEKKLQHFPVAGAGRIEHDLDRLRMAAVVAIGRIGHITAGVADAEELVRRTHERAAQQRNAEPPRKRNKREQASDARRKVEADALTQSLREIYRKLASSLHPDRERDVAVRAEKTALMQRINIAYQNKDLLALLTLQMEVEQINSASLGDVPEARLAQYNQILREQLDTLKAQQQALLQTLFDVFEPTGNRRTVSAKDFDRVIDTQKKHFHGLSQHLDRTIAELKDPVRRIRSVDQIVAAIAEQEKRARMQEREDARMARYFGF